MTQKTYLTDQQFAEIYNAAPSRAEAARQMGITFGSMQNRARRIHKAGRVQLKRFRWGKPGLMTWLKENHPEVWEEWNNLTV